tara:strand:- start:1040 stop:1756 length:717 start_codon:yes stop_codon:yes gene_type:complete
MNIAVVTTWNHKLFKEYGHRFVDTYKWPFDLFVYSEDAHGCKLPILKETYNIFKETPQCKDFIERFSHKKRPSQGFLFDAGRFSYKVYAYTDFILNKSEGYDGLIYMDADSVFYRPCDAEWIKRYVHRDDCISSYLGRGQQYTETGFLYFNLQHKMTKLFAERIQNTYTNDDIYKLKEWHDCEVYDEARKYYTTESLRHHNIGDDQPGHVQTRSCIGSLYDHTKGPRKKTGVSPEFRG